MSYSNSLAEPIIDVNDFVFCKNHGNEYCIRCFYDHRMTNNYQILNDLPEEVTECMEYTIDDREPFNAYALGAVAKPGNSDKYQCSSHRKVDCKTCFDWIGFIKKQAKEAEDCQKWLAKRKKWFDRLDD